MDERANKFNKTGFDKWRFCHLVMEITNIFGRSIVKGQLVIQCPPHVFMIGQCIMQDLFGSNAQAKHQEQETR